MSPDDVIGELLRSAACVDRDDAALAAVRRAASARMDWNEAIRQAELHGMAPWLYRRLRESDSSLPSPVRLQLKGLALRHQQSNRIRARALGEILAALAAREVDVLLLKGAALAHMIYEEPGLRPMCDVDLLVSPARLDAATTVLAHLGYIGDEREVLLPDHHHLPTLSRVFDGLQVSVEIHRDAIAPDNLGTIGVDSLSEPARPFRLGDGNAMTLGHVDMLRHLCRHALQPREVIKIGSALDIMLYASVFADEIDWRRIKDEFPEVITALRLFGFLVPWPAALSAHIPAPVPPPPADTGLGMIPLSDLRRRPDRLSQILRPSEWWLRAFYDVPPGRSLLPVRWFRHPARVAFWLWRRRARAAA